MQLVQLLLCVREDATLEGSPLSSYLSSAGLNELNSLAHIDSAHGLSSIALGAGMGRGLVLARKAGRLLLLDSRLSSDLIDCPAELLSSIDHRSELAADDAVLEEHLGVVEVVIDAKLTFEKIIVERVVKGNPMKVSLGGGSLESSKRKTN